LIVVAKNNIAQIIHRYLPTRSPIALTALMDEPTSVAPALCGGETSDFDFWIAPVFMASLASFMAYCSYALLTPEVFSGSATFY
jgi:hypothetical protein